MSEKKISKGIIALLLVVIVILAGMVVYYATKPPPKPLTHIRFTTGWVLGGYASPYILAFQKGFFAEEGLDVKIVRGYGAGDAVMKVAAGTYDAAHADLSTLMEFKARNPDADVIAICIIYDYAPFSIVTIRDRGIKEPKDLENRKISSIAAEPSRLLFPLFAKKVGIDEKTITWVTVSAELRSSMVLKGEVDAVAGYCTTVAGEMDGLGVPLKDLVIFRYSDYGLPLFGNAIVVRETWLKDHPEEVKAVIRGWLYTKEHPDEALDTLLKQEPLLDRKAEELNLRLVLDLLVFTPRVNEHGLGYASEDEIKKAIDAIVEGYNLPGKPPIEEIYTSKFLPPIEERLPPK
ncbi:MAG: ABC transporter substrate-binding protein [Candidatus Bathyarchaeia archaeon]